MRVIRSIPWLVAGLCLTGIWVAGLRFGGAPLLVVGWGLILLVAKGMAGTTVSRAAALTIDAALAAVCLAAAFEAGWYVLPAVLTFAVYDGLGIPTAPPPLPPGSAGNEIRLAVAAAMVGWLGLALGVSWPLYASATTQVFANGTVVTTRSAPSPLEAGLSISEAAVLWGVAIAFDVVLAAAIVHARKGGPVLLRALLVAVVALCALAGAGTVMIGPWALPGVGLGVAALWIGRREGRCETWRQTDPP